MAVDIVAALILADALHGWAKVPNVTHCSALEEAADTIRALVSDLIYCRSTSHG